MKPEYIAPEQIEERSFQIITQELDIELSGDIAPIIKRVIHTTADFDYAHNLYFSAGVVEKALKALKSGVDVVCDTNMAKAGINKAALGSMGGSVHCFMADEDVADEARARGITRASVSMERAAKLQQPLIFAIGNAPTALMRLHELYRGGSVAPQLVVAAPVGFVNVVESKELFVDCGLPVIVARGRKGGSNVAAAILNALIYMAKPRHPIV